MTKVKMVNSYAIDELHNYIAWLGKNAPSTSMYEEWRSGGWLRANSNNSQPWRGENMEQFPNGYTTNPDHSISYISWAWRIIR